MARGTEKPAWETAEERQEKIDDAPDRKTAWHRYWQFEQMEDVAEHFARYQGHSFKRTQYRAPPGPPPPKPRLRRTADE